MKKIILLVVLVVLAVAGYIFKEDITEMFHGQDEAQVGEDGLTEAEYQKEEEKYLIEETPEALAETALEEEQLEITEQEILDAEAALEAEIERNAQEEAEFQANLDALEDLEV